MSVRLKRLLLIGATLCSAAMVVLGLAVRLQHGAADALPNTGAPAGFTITSVASGLVAPTVAQFAPDGRIFVGQKDGTVKIVKNGQVIAQPFYVAPNVNNYVDRGLLGLTLDPNFAANGYVYLLYTYDNNPGHNDASKTGRLVRVTANGDTAVAGSEKVILGNVIGTPAQPSCENYPVNTDCIPDDYFSHGPDTLQFGKDGKLYVSIGESASYDNVDVRAFRAQNVDSLAGKILRLNPDGTGPSDNPFYDGDPTHVRSKVYAYGLRNPFRFAVRPSDGVMVVGDVGWGTWEEVNVIFKGANFGWPCYEGNAKQTDIPDGATASYSQQAQCQQMYANPPATLSFPKYTYPHPPSSAVVGGMFYTGTNYPAQYQNMFFFGDYARDQIYTMQFDANDNMVVGSQNTFASNTKGPVCFFSGPNGDLYYAGINTGAIYHLQYSTTNQPPTAIAASDTTSGPAPLTVKFTSAGSFDPENDPLTYSWNFGDGSAADTTPTPTHTYTTKGVYNAVLTVTDSHGQSSPATVKIYAGILPPALTINSPADPTVANVGQTINFSGSATDPQTGPMPASSLHWKVVIDHCPLSSCHVHVLTTVDGQAGGSFTFPPHDGPYYLEISLSATNSVGLSSTKTVTIYPAGEKIARALSFDGLNDYASAALPDDFKLQQFTVEAKIKALTTDDGGGEVVTQGENWTLRVLPDGSLRFSFANGGGWEEVIANNVNLKDGIWHHVAVTKTGTTVKLYADGQVIAASEMPLPIEYKYGNVLYIGQNGNGDNHFNFNGAIDEVRIWNAPRTDADVQQYNSMSIPAAQLGGLVAYYKLDEGSGTTAADSSANHNHPLSLINGTGWTAGAPMSEPTTPLSQLTDTFTGLALDTTKWNRQGAASQTVQNNLLSITPTANAAGYFGVFSKQRYDLTGSYLMVEVPQTTPGGVAAETQVVLEQDSTSRIAIIRGTKSLVLRQRANNANSDTFVPYDATSMRWWRIREAAGTVYLETSPDASTWTVRRSFAKTFDITNLQVTLNAGTYQTVANPGIAQFDNVNTLPPPPVINDSLALDGSTGKATTNGAGLYNLQTFTLETWVKLQSVGTHGSEIISNGDNYALRVLPTGNLYFFTHDGNYVYEDYKASGVNLLDNAWHHVAVVKSATTVTFYVDGVAKGSLPVTGIGPISYTLGPNLVVGAHGEGDAGFNLNGSIDEVRIWNVARSAADIQANWRKEIAPQTGLVGYWQLNDGAGITATDVSGNNHPLSLMGGATWGSGFPKQ